MLPIFTTYFHFGTNPCTNFGTNPCSIMPQMHQSGQTRVQTNAIKSTFLKKWCILKRFFSGAFPNPCTLNAPLLIFLGQTRVVFFSPKSQLTLIYQRFQTFREWCILFFCTVFLGQTRLKKKLQLFFKPLWL